MTSLRCLYFEDDQNDFSTISHNLRLAWDTVGKESLAFVKTGDSVGRLEITHLSDNDKATKELSENGGKYDLLVLDLILEDPKTAKPRNVGTPLADYARGMKFGGGIIGISGVEQSEFRGSRIDFEDKAALAAAGPSGTYGRYFIQKADLFETEDIKFYPTDLGRIICRVLIDSGVLQERNSPGERIRVFISHSHEDRNLAKNMVDLLARALKIGPDEIRCTSVPGCDLSGGDPSAEVLKKNLQDCDIVIGLITPKSLTSSFVLFELGAAWGLSKRLIPFLGPDFAPGIMRAPLRDLHSYMWRNRADWEKIIDDLAMLLRIEKQRLPFYSQAIDDILAMPSTY